MSADPALYTFINQGVLTVDGMSDVDEMKLTDVSYIYIADPERWGGGGGCLDPPWKIAKI